jgi:hypothetical protein
VKRRFLVGTIVLATVVFCGAPARAESPADSAPSTVTSGRAGSASDAPLQLDETERTTPIAEQPVPGQPTVSGPTVKVEPNVVKPGERAWITMSGFSSHGVVITVCGNEAHRGSGDCNMEQSQGFGLTPGQTSAINMIISEPPTNCPCIIRVSSQGSTEIAAAPITITGHPIGPIIEPPSFGDLVRVEIRAKESPQSIWGYLRPELGGQTPYDVTVSVKNLTTGTLHDLKIFSAVGRTETDYLADVTFGTPGDLPAGHTWTQTVRAVVKAPAVGTLQWRASVSGAGNTVTAYDAEVHKPLLLTGLSLVAVASFFSLIIRFLVRRHIRIDEAKAQPESSAGPGPIDATSRPLDDLVSTG